MSEIKIEDNVEKLGEDELFKRIEDSEMLLRFEKSEDWKYVREACKAMVHQTQMKLLWADPKDVVKIAQNQMAIKIFGNFIQSLINMHKMDGILCLDEVKDRGLTSKLSKMFK